MRKDDKQSRPFKYIWLDIVRRWKHQSDIGKYKAFGGAIVHFLHGEAVTCYPSLPKLAIECGMSERTTSTAADAFESASLIARGSGGGNSKSSDYCLLLPCNCLQGLDLDTLQAYEGYLAKVIAEPCKIDPDTLQLFARELKNYLRTIDNQNAGAGQIEGMKDRDQIQSPSLDPSNKTERKSEPHSETSSTSPRDTARASLPVATAAQRAAWDGAWPDDDCTVKQFEGSKSMAWRFVIHDCLDVMGYQWRGDDQGDIRMPEGSAFKYRDAWLESLLPPDTVDEMTARKMAGTLTTDDIANVLASLNITPKAQKRQEAIREA